MNLVSLTIKSFLAGSAYRYFKLKQTKIDAIRIEPRLTDNAQTLNLSSDEIANLLATLKSSRCFVSLVMKPFYTVHISGSRDASFVMSKSGKTIRLGDSAASSATLGWKLKESPDFLSMR